MREWIKNFIVCFVVGFFVLSTFVLRVKAQSQEPQGAEKSVLQVSPILNEIAAKPGEVVKKLMVVKNLSSLPLPIKSYSRAFIATDEIGGSDYPDIKDPKEVQNWFDIKEPDFILQPQSSKTVEVAIAVPKDARPGGHYATLFFESLIPKEALSETSFFLSSRIGALFFFVVAGDLQEKGTITNLTTKKFNQNSPIIFNLAFKNEGNVHLKPRTTITVTDWRGNVVDTFIDEGKTTLPEKTRRWDISWNKQKLFGKYTITSETTISELSTPIKRSFQFWVIPVTKISIFLLGFILLALFYFGRFRIKKALLVLGDGGINSPSTPITESRSRKSYEQLTRDDKQTRPLSLQSFEKTNTKDKNTKTHAIKSILGKILSKHLRSKSSSGKSTTKANHKTLSLNDLQNATEKKKRSFFSRKK